MLRHSQPSFYNDSSVVYVCPVCSLLMAECSPYYCTTAECGLEVADYNTVFGAIR